MKVEEQQLILRVTKRQISVDEFVLQFGVDPRVDRELVPTLLRKSLETHSAADVEYALLLAFTFDLSASWAPILAELLEQDWHESHENLASCLQDIRDPTTVETLYRGAQKRLNYLAFDEAFALGVKCVWALHDIGTAQAIERLRSLTCSEVVPIREAAVERLDALAQRRPGDPVPAYRLAREAGVRR